MLKEEKYTYIYGLREKNTDEIRYVGKSDNPYNRKTEHIRESKKLTKTHKNNWIRKVINSGNNIEVVILEKVGYSQWESREIWWINQFSNLTNECEGGLSAPPKDNNFLVYEEIKEWVKVNLPNIKSRNNWNKYFKENKKPDFIPYDPYQTYRNNGWISWGEFLNTGNLSAHKNSKKYLTYEKAKEWYENSGLKIKSGREWMKMRKLKIFPDFIPSIPESYYWTRGWGGWLDFLNLKKRFRPPKKYLTYNEAKIWIKNYMPMGIKTVNDWRKFNKPDITNIPTNAYSYYTKQGTWVSWVEFLKR